MAIGVARYLLIDMQTDIATVIVSSLTYSLASKVLNSATKLLGTYPS